MIMYKYGFFGLEILRVMFFVLTDDLNSGDSLNG